MEFLESPLVFKVTVLAVTAIVALILQRIMVRASSRMLERAKIPNATIFVNIIRSLIWFLALLSVLEPVFGVQPTAFVAALGVTSIAVSFGLQSTVSNVISGFGLMLFRVIEVGDVIEVGSYQGTVTDITWRATTIRTVIGDVVVIPNSVLNTTTLRRLAPLSYRAITLPLDVHPEADLVEVERDVLESVSAAVGEWVDPELGVVVIQQGYGSFGFRMDVRIGLRDIADGLKARSAAIAACSGRSWLARW